MEKILVTGVNGFVGKHLTDELRHANYDVIGVGGQQSSSKSNIELAEYYTLDLTNPGEANKIDFKGVSGVIHLAGLAAVGPSFDEPMKYVDTNIGIEVNLFEAALKQGSKPKFIIVSSGSLYDPKAPLPINEDSKVLPNSPYAVSKLGQEQMAEYYAGRGFEYVIARPFNHLGPGQNPGFIAPDIAQQVIKIQNGSEDSLLLGNLDAKRDYTDVRDIAVAYRLLFEKGEIGQTYNVCSGKSYSGHEILKGILDAAGINPPVEQDPSKMRPSDTPEIVGDNSKLRKETGWSPRISISQTMKDVFNDWEKREAV